MIVTELVDGLRVTVRLDYGQAVSLLVEPEDGVSPITASAVKAIKLGDLVSRACEPLVELALERFGLEIDREAGMPGPAGRTNGFYARVASQYLELTQAGEFRPLSRMAERYGKPSRTVENWLREARARGLLTTPRPGKSGGQLTTAGKGALR